MEERKARYVGIDVGKATMVVRILQEEGEKIHVTRWHGKTDGKGRASLTKMLKTTDVVGIEAGEPGFTVAREIKERTGADVLVLNPGKLAVIYRSMRKTDAEDALKLARLVMRIPADELPVVAIPSADERRKRALVSEDDFLKVTRTRIILRLHSVYIRAGVTHLERKDLKSEDKRRTALEQLAGKPGYYREEAERLGRLLEKVEEETGMIEKSIKKELQESELAPVLLSVPGVGPAMAMAFISHIGDGSRFGNASQLNNYVGFVPRIDFSGQSERTGHITKRGCKHIRRIAVQSAWALVRSKQGGELKEKYLDLWPRRGKKIAIVAIARKLVGILWTLVCKKELYRNISNEELELKYRSYGFNFQGSGA
jgi:transposase